MPQRQEVLADRRRDGLEWWPLARFEDCEADLTVAQSGERVLPREDLVLLIEAEWLDINGIVNSDDGLTDLDDCHGERIDIALLRTRLSFFQPLWSHPPYGSSFSAGRGRAAVFIKYLTQTEVT